MVFSCVPDTEVRLLCKKCHYGIAWTLNITGADMVAWVEMLDMGEPYSWALYILSGNDLGKFSLSWAWLLNKTG